MKTIRFHGILGQKYGTEFKLDVKDPVEAIQFIAYQVDGFAKDLSEGDYRVTKTKDGKEIDLDMDTIQLGSVANEFDFYPIPAGAKSGDGKIIGGLGLVALAIATGGVAIAGVAISAGTIATVGVGVALAGLAVNLAPEIDTSTAEKDNVSQNPSYVFDGPQNSSGGNKTIGLAYGKQVRAGANVVSAGTDTTRMPNDND